MTRQEYVQELREKKRRFGRNIIAAIIASIALLAAADFQVRWGFVFAMPPAVTRYMFDTGPMSFSKLELRRILLTNNGIDEKLFWLLAIYWGWFLGIAVLLIVLPVILESKVRQFKVPAVRGLLLSNRLEQLVIAYEKRKTRRNLRRLLFACDHSRMFELILPVKEDWETQSNFEWFRSSAVQGDEGSVLHSVDSFADTLYLHASHNVPIRAFVEPLKLLQEFFFSVAKRSVPKLQALTEQDPGSSNAERVLLVKFAQQVSPLIDNATLLKVDGASISHDSWVHRIVSAPLVKNCMILSLVAGVVMTIGVVLFRIPINQAFLTWFTVTFGSLTISVGVTAVSVKDKKESIRLPGAAEHLEGPQSTLRQTQEGPADPPSRDRE